ncbi:MAG: ComEC/Rec2 family competence protein [Lachnospiraceae bacterium]|nr:ComEC/Rec2 family competence protein [Lachnospiraceae bacterium]
MKRPACFIACLILLFLIIYLQLRPPDPFSDDRIRGQTITVSGTVDDKYSKNSSDYLIIKDTAIISGLQSAANGKVIIKLKESEEDLSHLPVTGSGVCITGKGMIFSEARNPGNFDLAAYEMVRGIDYELYDAVILSEKTPVFNPGLLDEYMCRIREKLKDTACLIYGEEDSGIVCAMLLGDRTGLSDEIKDGYRRSGMSHILCISAA